MKQKYILIGIAFSLAIISAFTIGVIRHNQAKLDTRSNDSISSPTVSYKSGNNNDSFMSNRELGDRAEGTASDHTPTISLGSSDRKKEPSHEPTNSPKQDAVRETIATEHIYRPLLTANDPRFQSNWTLQKINAPSAWNMSTGNGETVVAVIDSGFALNHEDLADTWLINTAETGATKFGDRCWNGSTQEKRTNNCDDDNNGYLDDWRGWNFSLGDNNPATGRTNPTGAAVAHGTEVSGLVGATGNNAKGITTVNWNTKIMPLQALSDDGPGYTSDVAAAIYYAVDNGADVINLSLGGSQYDPALKVATDYAYTHDVIVVAAAGNCGAGSEDGCQGLPAGFIGYPALNDHVIAVGATNINDQRAGFSSYGPALDIVAPGSGTISSPSWTASSPTSLYAGALYGTSYSTPITASLVALIKSVRPQSKSDDIISILLGTATKLPAMNNAPYTNEMGHGMLNANAALEVATSLNATTVTPSLLQAGGSSSEHSYATTESLGSGCRTALGTYCTVWLRNQQTGYERYLPYKNNTLADSVGWSWGGNILPLGEWVVRAVQGERYSPVYTLSAK